MSWDDLIIEAAPKQVKKEEPKPKMVREVIERPKVEKSKDDQSAVLRQRIRELERIVQQQNEQFQQMHREIGEKNNRIRELEQTAEHSDITTADKRNLQFLVNCVAKTYKIEFRKQRAPAVRLALENIIERFELETPDEMENV